MFKLSTTGSLCCFTATALLLAMAQTAPAQTTNFDAGGDGFTWTDPLNWDNGEPDLATHNAVIDGAIFSPFNVQLSTSRTIGTVRVGDGDILRLLNASSLTPANLAPISQVAVNSGGTLRIESTGSNTDLRIETGVVNLTGGGTIQMVGVGARITDGGGFVDGELVNLDLFIHGQGQIGVNRTKISNFSTIRADVPGATLTLDPDSRNMVNEGVLEATSGGILLLNAATYTNTLGEIRAQTDSFVRLSGGPTINGGMLTTIGNGIIETNNAAKVTLNGVTLDGLLRIDNSDNVELIGTFTDNPTSIIRINSTGSNTGLRIESAVTLTGGGTVEMIGPGARITDESGLLEGILINTDHLIHGQGQIGVNRTQITNNSTIRADVNGTSLVLDPDPRGMVNTNLLEATSGATLQLNLGTYTNTGGTIRAQTGSTVSFSGGPTITNGTLQAVGTGLFQTADAAKVTLNDVTLDGLLRIDNSDNVELTGTFTDNPTSIIRINSTGSNTGLRIESAVTLTGGGTVEMIGPGARITDESGLLEGILINTDHLIHGQGQIGVNRTQITNNSTIRADVNGTSLVLDPDPRGMVNTNLLEATSGATLQLNLGTYTNTGGTIRAQTGSTVSFSGGPTITNGTLQTVGTGIIETGTATLATLNDVTLDGLLRINNTDNIELTGTFTDNATSVIRIDAVGSLTDLIIQGNVTLTGGGTIEMIGATARILDEGGAVLGHLTNNDHLIHGQGQIGVNRTQLTNGGTIASDVALATMTIDVDARGLINTGTLQAINTSTLRIADAFANDGAIEAAAGSTVRIDGTLTNNLTGVLSGNGVFQMGSTGVVDIQNNGTITPGASPGGLLFDTGTLTFGATGKLVVELGGLVAGTDYDRVDVLGDVVLAGTLDATIFGGFPLTIGDTFDVMVANGSITGTFDTVNLPAGPGAGFGIFYGSNFVRLTVGLIQGDLNFDGFVGISDLNIVLGNWNLNVTPGDVSLGDPSGDGFVGIDDLNAVLGNWNGGTAFPSAPTPPAASASVPEPATLGLVMLGGIALAGRRRH